MMSSFAGDEQDYVPGVPAQVELVNLTPHTVRIHARSVPRPDDDAHGERLVVLPQPIAAQPGMPVVTCDAWSTPQGVAPSCEV